MFTIPNQWEGSHDPSLKYDLAPTKQRHFIEIGTWFFLHDEGMGCVEFVTVPQSMKALMTLTVVRKDMSIEAYVPEGTDESIRLRAIGFSEPQGAEDAVEVLQEEATEILEDFDENEVFPELQYMS